MQTDDGAKAVPETILNDSEDWLTIIEGSLHVIPQDHWGIGATIKVRLDGDRLIISADEPGYSENTSVRIPALTTRREPAADAIERAAKAITNIWNKPSSNPTAFPASAETLARAALQAAAVQETGLDALLDSVWQDSDPVEISDLVIDGDRWSVWIRSCYTVKHVDADHPLYHVAHGTGATRYEAIADAVRQANGAEGGEG